ncbi:acyl carrier protein [Clostridium celatum]|uniref:Putative acyl carrier protein n=1 Tax=Clostridium celatum DSM 1785 TaxID=545697 RepID=L1Q2V0_9CLOT|nr:acyl carrier protein [Clostridium celatum]EKY22236.1 putative acyl carrier protein [Clostridium celatum DSM 1785]MCE9654640.1 acyl carrier protein [Clostridium celatum]MDU2265116.1 acyl carrier protein [Clostridium celatum]MDU3721971.1 acyl carrier protein [Clostridium celatum]MDU6295119.1 acyl carrier protein [Clostridium celatum]
MLEKLRELLSEYVEVAREDITVESKLVEDLGLNSYEFMTLVGDLEEEFDVEVNEREVAKVNTIGDIIEYITALQV